MRKPWGRIAATLVAGALITLAAAPAAIADDTDVATTTSSAVPETTSSSAAPETTTTSDSPQSTENTEPSSTDSAPSATDTTSAQSTESSKPSDTSSPDETTTPEEPPYEDNQGWGVDLEDGYGMVIISCAAGEPTGLTSPDFDVVDGPYQEVQDGRYWDFLVQLHDGKTFADNDIAGDWTCAGPQGGGAGSGSIAPVPGSESSGDWQSSNGGDAQVSFAPKTGVETGFGGLAQG
ncbi:hypothetical protein FPZ12_010730 [Amycolatopsis acidicola]|uniref:Secreted protein n=1 Tax=Amycolatopsis acidicola TaxID=2596893 RepID=A0A5N0VBS2_9PSEU|nr:hypothetical protein [Amycolatopsis acidicola]KAA9162974.1 hypothetical protein FPZ12_010730 [Amycolatopsis acidicola]